LIASSAVKGLATRLADRIRREGPLRFDIFQELALYDPDDGYYERPGRVGRPGDFITAASWHPAFARCLARVARDVQASLGTAIDVVDVGAGEGELLEAMCGALRDEAGGNREFRFIGIERSVARCSRARERFGEGLWFSSFDGISRFSGLVIAYELFDALPVRSLVFEGEKLLERFVAVGGEGTGEFFEWKVAECEDSDALLESLRARGAVLRPGQILEVRPSARSLALSLSQMIVRGLLLVFDYGAFARSLYGPARILGTLEAFRAHQVTRDVLSDPGSRDITAWVDFTEIETTLRESGLSVAGLVSQSRFLAAAGIGEEIEAAEARPTEAERLVERHALGELVAPGGMGESIRVLVASRGADLGRPFVEWPERK
jgi:SAM-dependent MidA family methyltransferase